ncbi:uncharacterized protein KY384_002200 [Bacidia gigantensis]|uniref:uncharacterized protein n=1 Tax=Bacidia gigantensis TaxID=2732470 RepID=UPI001D03B08D|nr:uncharacterized protein KY384_002200 [Bacidia gigantensis]KAG8533417.1 hypothetical protein KY384_002200 [Bacidia gigantensis]
MKLFATLFSMLSLVTTICSRPLTLDQRSLGDVIENVIGILDIIISAVEDNVEAPDPQLQSLEDQLTTQESEAQSLQNASDQPQSGEELAAIIQMSITLSQSLVAAVNDQPDVALPVKDELIKDIDKGEADLIALYALLGPLKRDV